MHILLDLVGREAALLTILCLLGSGPAALLAARFDGASRIALAPLLGFCLGTCVTTTILQFAPTNDTYWILIPLALASVALAVARRRGSGSSGWPSASELIALVIIVLAVAGPTTYVLTERHTVGPAVYSYTDVDNYVAVQDAARTMSLHDARNQWLEHAPTGARFGDLTQFIWAYFANSGSNLDATPLDSNVNALLGLGATDTFAPFLIVLLLAGALAAFAAVRYLAKSRTWTATMAGCLFGGPMFLELWFDSFQAAIVAIGVIVPFVLLIHSAVQTRRRMDLVLVALVVATMLSVYPLYLAPMVAIAAAMLAWDAARGRRAGQPLRTWLSCTGRAVLAVAGLSIVFDLVGFTRDLRYYKSVLNGQLAFPRVGYHLPLSVLPGWIAQTREFWNMPPLGSAGAKDLLLGGLLPIVFAAFAAIGLRRHRLALAVVAVAIIFAVLAEYAYLSQQSCTYCAERDLLPLTPIFAVLVALGLGAVAAVPNRWATAAAAVGVLLIVVAVGQRSRVELTRFANSSYFMDTADRTVLGRLPAHAGSIQEEGFGASTSAQAEQPLVYHLINERTGGDASIVLGSDLGNAIQYLDFGGPMAPGPEFNPEYRYVLTRLASVATDRRVIARIGSIALEQRVQPLDVTPYAGLAVPLNRVADGPAWVQTQSPLEMYVVGTDGRRRAWAKLTLHTATAVSVAPQPGVRSHLSGDTLTICVAAQGREPIRRAAVTIDGTLHPGLPPAGLFPPAMPLEGVALSAMRAVTGSCSP